MLCFTYNFDAEKWYFTQKQFVRPLDTAYSMIN